MEAESVHPVSHNQQLASIQCLKEAALLGEHLFPYIVPQSFNALVVDTGIVDETPS